MTPGTWFLHIHSYASAPLLLTVLAGPLGLGLMHLRGWRTSDILCEFSQPDTAMNWDNIPSLSLPGTKFGYCPDHTRKKLLCPTPPITSLLMDMRDILEHISDEMVTICQTC